MAVSVSREMILPALRLDVPPRPSERQLAAFAERSAEEWTTTTRDWVTHQVVRLAVAEVLRARLEQAATTHHERHPLPADVTQVTMAQLVAWFRPHVGLAGQAFQLGIVEAVNAGVPAVVDPMREGLRRIGITGRDPVRMLSLGLEKVPARARGDFWTSVRSAAALTAVVDVLTGGASDVSSLDRSHLTRADAIVLSGGRAVAVAFPGRPPADGGGAKSWLSVPMSIGRKARGGAGSGGDAPRRGGQDGAVEVGLRSTAWVEVFESALDAVGSAMQQIDTGARPKGRPTPLVEAIVLRLVAAKARPVAEVCASLRAVDELTLEMYDHQVTTTSVRVAVPVVEDDHFMQLWLPTSALAGPLFTGSADLFMGDGADVRMLGAAPAKQGGRPGAAPGGRQGGREGDRQGDRQGGRRSGKPDQPGRGGGGGGRPPRPEGAPSDAADKGAPREGAGRSRRGRGKRPAGQESGGQEPGGQPAAEATQPSVPSETQPGETQPPSVPAPAAQPPAAPPATPSPDES